MIHLWGMNELRTALQRKAWRNVNFSHQCVLAAQKVLLYLGLHEMKFGQQVEGGDFGALPCSCETASGVLAPSSGLSNARKT